jgi:flavin-binding protein dodecin
VVTARPACRPPVPQRPLTIIEEEEHMSIAKVSEISATSSKSFEDAIVNGIARANKTLRNIRSAWVKEQQIRVREGVITEYQVNLMVTFVIDD